MRNNLFSVEKFTDLTMKSKPSAIFSLEQQFSFYKHYHANTINKRIHMVFVPILVVTGQALLIAVSLPPPISDLGRLVTALFIAYYIALHTSIGICFAPFLAAGYLIASAATSSVSSRTSIPIAAALHVLSWAVQIAGHLIFEGRRPAIVDSIVQSVLAAPVMIWLDYVFMLGLAPDLKSRLNRARVVAKARKAVATVE